MPPRAHPKKWGFRGHTDNGLCGTRASPSEQAPRGGHGWAGCYPLSPSGGRDQVSDSSPRSSYGRDSSMKKTVAFQAGRIMSYFIDKEEVQLVNVLLKFA